jgi:hypothetical protein
MRVACLRVFAAALLAVATAGVAVSSTPTSIRGLSLEEVEAFAANTASVWVGGGWDRDDYAFCVEDQRRIFLCAVTKRRDFGVVYNCRKKRL